MEDWTCLGQHKRQPEFPVVTRESRRNSRKTTWLPRHRKMKPFPATAPQEKSHVRNWRSKGHLAPWMRGLALNKFACGDEALNLAAVYTAGVLIASWGTRPLRAVVLHGLTLPTTYAMVGAILLRSLAWRLPVPFERAVTLLGQ